jgi:hypothetical protein
VRDAVSGVLFMGKGGGVVGAPIGAPRAGPDSERPSEDFFSEEVLSEELLSEDVFTAGATVAVARTSCSSIFALAGCVVAPEVLAAVIMFGDVLL